MTRLTHIMQFMAAALIVVVLGGLLGWYYFVHRQVQTTATIQDARGSVTPSFGSPTGSANANNNASPAFTTGAPANASGTTRGVARLWHVTKDPVAGFSFAATSTQLFYVEIATGNILEADPSDGSVERLTNTLLPKTYEAFLASDGSALLRFMTNGTLQTFAGLLATSTEAIDSTSTPETLRGLYLPQNILAIATLPQHQLVYVLQNPTGGSVVVTSDWRGANQKKIFSSTLEDWRLITLPDGTIMISQKPSDGIPGSAYALTRSGALSPILRGLPGLIVLPRGGGAQIYSLANGSFKLYAQTGPNATAAYLPIHTTADKCVWAPGSALIAYCAVPQKQYALDARAQGAEHSTDTWYKVDVSAGTAEQIFMTDSSLSLDVEKPTIDASGSYLAFDNASDRTLWTLRIAP